MKTDDKLFEVAQYDQLRFNLSDLENVYLSSFIEHTLGDYKDHFRNMLKVISRDAIAMYGYDAAIKGSFSIDNLSFSIESENLYPHWTDTKELEISFFDMDSSSIEDCNKALGNVLNNFSKMRDYELFSDINTFMCLFNAIKNIDTIFENRYSILNHVLVTGFSVANHNSNSKLDFWTIKQSTLNTKGIILMNADFKISISDQEFEIFVKDTHLRSKNRSNNQKFLSDNLLNIYNHVYETDYINMKDFLDVLEMKLYS